LATEDEMRHAMAHPPRSTRAFTRGSLVTHHPRQLVGAAWDNVVLRVCEAARLWRIDLSEPLRGSAADLPGWWSSEDSGPDEIPEPGELAAGLQRVFEQQPGL
ncbi:MAG: proteasome accessory factor PafA2 family protein, partial [Micrococcus sp.]|nr:proteasome accessory factor PafA2 family protein [Micrococcus sp.]